MNLNEEQQQKLNEMLLEGWKIVHEDERKITLYDGVKWYHDLQRTGSKT